MVAFARFDDPLKVGQADFCFESPEPSLDELKTAYPAGEYRFRGRSVDGTKLKGSAELSHELLDGPLILFPMEGQTNVPINGLIAMWDPIDEADAIRFEFEDEEEETTLTVDLPGDATQFEIPNNWMSPETEYTLDVKAIAENGNQTVADLQFTTER